MCTLNLLPRHLVFEYLSVVNLNVAFGAFSHGHNDRINYFFYYIFGMKWLKIVRKVQEIFTAVRTANHWRSCYRFNEQTIDSFWSYKARVVEVTPATHHDKNKNTPSVLTTRAQRGGVFSGISRGFSTLVYIDPNEIVRCAVP